MRKLLLILGLIGVLIIVLFIWEMVAFDKNKKWSLICRNYSFNSWVQTQATNICTNITKFNKGLRSKFLGVQY